MKITKIFEKNNLHIQTLEYSCGPCSIWNVLEKKWIESSEDELLKICKATPENGCEIKDIIFALKQFDLEIVEQDEKSFYFEDSSFGLFRLGKDEFAKFWHNWEKTVVGWFVAVK